VKLALLMVASLFCERPFDKNARKMGQSCLCTWKAWASPWGSGEISSLFSVLSSLFSVLRSSFSVFSFEEQSAHLSGFGGDT
jgi:hypothetical protein